MKRALLFLITLCITTSFFAQTPGKPFKLKNKTAVPYSTTFTPTSINGQSSLKSAKIVNTPGVYQMIGSSALTLQTLKADDKKIIYGADSITPIYIERHNASQLKSTNIQTTEQRCFEFLENIKQDLHIAKPSECFTITDSRQDDLGQQHIRLSQKFNGIKIYKSDFYVHFAGDKEILNGKYNIISSSLNTVPKIPKEQALQIALSDLKSRTAIMEFTDAQKDFFNYPKPRIDTVILGDKQSFTKNNLVYHITIRPNLIDEWYYFVNAANGTIINKFNNTKYDGPATATAADLNGVARSVNTYLEKGSYTLVDATEPMFNAAKNEGLIITLDAQNTNGSKYAEISTTNNTWTNNPKAVSAHYNAKQAYLYFKNTFNRNSINGSGGNIYSFINVANADGTGLDNAFWNGKIMCYGNGNLAFKPLAGSIDVAAHEMAHGVTQNTAALEYQGETGAINESFSDIFGSMVDRTNWYIGELITKTTYIPSGRLRDMSNPHNGSTNGNAGWQPMHTSEMYLGTDDNGGVHTNSGIPNYAYYLLATAITKEKAEQIFYRALTNYLTKSAQFIDLRIAVTQSAKDLYTDNSNEVKQTKIAFDAVGIYEEQPNNYIETFPVNPGSEYLLMDNTDTTDPNSLYKSSIDGTNLLALTQTKMKSKASAVDNGSGAVFVSTDHKIRAITLGSTPVEKIISADAIWDNVAISKDGNRLAAITTDVDTAIYVYDFVTSKWAKFHLYNPTTEGAQQGGGVLYADAIEFDHTGEYILYDSYNLIKSTSTDSISYWDIGVLKVWDNQQSKFGDGTIAKLFSNLPDSVSIGDPVFSKNSPNIIAFDYLQGDNTFAVLGLNIETLDLGIIASNNTIGYPSFSKLDDKIAFSTLDNTSKQVIATIILNTDKISSSKTSEIIVNGAQWPVYYATGTRILGFPPKANFSASYKSGKAPLSTTFLDQSTNEPTAWEWTFESGLPHTSTVQNPVVSYSANGTYAVTLKATNSFGSNSVVKSGYIVVSNVTGVDELKSDDTFSVYPNPSSGVMQLSLKEPLESDYNIQVYTNLGCLVLTIPKPKGEQSMQLDLSGFPNGLYLIRLSSKTKTYHSRIIKQ